MSSFDPSKGVLLNLRVIDQEAAAELSHHLQSLLDRATSSAGALSQLLEQAQRALHEAPAMASRLEEGLRSGTSLRESLGAQLSESQIYLGELDSLRQALDGRCAKFAADVAASTERWQGLARETEQRYATTLTDAEKRLGSLAQESIDRVQKDFTPAFERAQMLAELIRNAEAALAVNAMRTALNGGVNPALAQPPMAVGPHSALQPQANDAETIELRARINELNVRCAELERKHHITAESQLALLSGVSQELRREIEMLMDSAEALRSTMLDQKQIDHLDDAAASAAALLEMIRGIPDLSFEQPPHPASAETDFDLRLEIQAMTGLLSKRAKDKGQTLTCMVENDVPSIVHGDCGRVRQILLYMINGAFKLAGTGEVIMRAHVEHTVDTHTSVRVTIAHQGNGIPQDKLGTIFHAVPMLDDIGSSPDGAELNTSLGLAVAKQLVQRLGGCVGVESDDEKHFELWFSVQWRKHVISADNRRIFNRLLLESVKSNLGPVIDLSLGGARIRCAKECAGQIELEVTDSETTVKLTAEVIWCSRLGWRKHEAGLRFLNVTPEIAEQLTRLTMQNRIRRVIDIS